MKSFSFFLAAAIVLAAGGRLVLLARSVRMEDRVSLSDRIASATSIQRQVFDADAAVLLTPGEDGLPGQAGLDDDYDGVTDNRSETGAVGSDDLCLAPWINGYQTALDSDEAVVICRGTFVSDGAVSAKDATGYQATENQAVGETRLLIQGRTGDVAWSRMWIGPAD